jgi:hypothetical protein
VIGCVPWARGPGLCRKVEKLPPSSRRRFYAETLAHSHFSTFPCFVKKHSHHSPRFFPPKSQSLNRPKLAPYRTGLQSITWYLLVLINPSHRTIFSSPSDHFLEESTFVLLTFPTIFPDPATIFLPYPRLSPIVIRHC